MNSFDLANFTSAIKCSILSICEAGSAAPGNGVRIAVFLSILLFAMFVFYAWHRCILSADKKFEQADYEEDEEENDLQKPFNVSDLGDFRRIVIEFKKLGLVLGNGERILVSVTGKLQDSSLVNILILKV